MLNIENLPLLTEELDLLAELIPLEGTGVLELGCGNARLARALLQRFPAATVIGLEVDTVQHRKNLENPQERLTFLEAGAQEIPLPDASLDVAIMLKSLHHVPQNLMLPALAEIGRVVRPGGFLYVSEPVYAGDLNEITRLYNDEGIVRAAAQAALDTVVLQGTIWQQMEERRFATPARWKDFADFESRMMRPSYAEHHLDTAKVEAVRQAFQMRVHAKGGDFVRPMHVRLLRRQFS